MNLGDDVDGAHRHRYSEEKVKQRQDEKNRKQKLNDLKNQFFALLGDDAESNKEKHRAYCAYVLITEWSFIGFPYNDQIDNQSLVNFTRQAMRQNDKVRKLYNRFTNQVFNARRCRTKDDYINLYTPKKVNRREPKIGEIVGYVGPWKLNFDNSETVKNDIKYFNDHGINLQFGKSVTDNERAYCVEVTASTLYLLEQLKFNLDFRGYTFAFGARGKAGAAAHYEPSTRVIQINRHRNGALIHEIGHAIDFKYNLLWKLPDSVFKNYRTKIESSNFPENHKRYLLNPREVTARAIERVMSEYFTCRGFACDLDASDWPNLSTCEIECLKELIFKRGENQ